MMGYIYRLVRPCRLKRGTVGKLFAYSKSKVVGSKVSTRWLTHFTFSNVTSISRPAFRGTGSEKIVFFSINTKIALNYFIFYQLFLYQPEMPDQWYLPAIHNELV